MRGLLYSNGKLQYRSDLPKPVPQSGESLIRVLKAGICRTDLEITRGYMDFSGVPGHEFVGVVEQSPNPAMVGSRVVGEINCGCNACAICKGGLQTHCADRTVLGIKGRDGAFAEYLAMPEANLHGVPDGMADEEAVFVEPVSAAYRIVEQVVVRGASVLVLGDGKLGLLIAQTLDIMGAGVTLCGRHRNKLAILDGTTINAVLEGELKKGKQYDVVVDATGVPAGAAKGMALTRPRGSLILKTTTAEKREIDLNLAVINEISVVGSRCGSFVHGMAIMETGKLKVRNMIDSEFPIEEGLRAFEAAGKPGAMKILLSF
ncbi:MAG: alcohol dehydrogenase catalytic domain-containing protein [Nitrospinae bacterium]|nr:alcohol dehydrogenase catalytic domain-containing protein [Nitrospinota bacterium]